MAGEPVLHVERLRKLHADAVHRSQLPRGRVQRGGSSRSSSAPTPVAAARGRRRTRAGTSGAGSGRITASWIQNHRRKVLSRTRPRSACTRARTSPARQNWASSASTAARRTRRSNDRRSHMAFGKRDEQFVEGFNGNRSTRGAVQGPLLRLQSRRKKPAAAGLERPDADARPSEQRSRSESRCGFARPRQRGLSRERAHCLERQRSGPEALTFDDVLLIPRGRPCIRRDVVIVRASRGHRDPDPDRERGDGHRDRDPRWRSRSRVKAASASSTRTSIMEQAAQVDRVNAL